MAFPRVFGLFFVVVFGPSLSALSRDSLSSMGLSRCTAKLSLGFRAGQRRARSLKRRMFLGFLNGF